MATDRDAGGVMKIVNTIVRKSEEKPKNHIQF